MAKTIPVVKIKFVKLVTASECGVGCCMIYSRALRYLPIFVFWFSGLLLAAKMNFVFDYDDPYKTIAPLDSSLQLLPWITAQSLMIWAILRPQTFAWSWGRSLAAAVISVLWTGFVVLGAMHAPGWHVANFYILLAADFILIILFVACFIVSAIKRKKLNPSIENSPR